MNHIQVKLKSGLILCLPFVCSCNREPARPNILFIMSDDHAEAAISAYGSPISKLAPTPNIDRIAHEGAIFNANYCCNSLSGPSRAAIMTGLHSHANGFMRNGNTFDGSQETLQKILGRNGWQTALIGKWHLNGKTEGFDYWTILNDQGEYYNPDFISENDTVRIDGYVTDIITEKCKKWIGERDKDRPFFLMMHHKACHRNWWPAERHYGKYDNVEFPLPETFFDDYSGRKAAKLQKMNIYRDMYEGHDLKMNVARGCDSLRFDPWPHLFKRMTPEQTQRFNDYYIARNDRFWDACPMDSIALANFTGINIGTLPSSLAASDNNSYDWGFTNCQIAGDGGQGLPNRLRPRVAGSCISIPTFGDRIVTKIRLYAHASNANMSTNTISLNDGEPVAFASFNESSNVNKNGGILEIDVPETLQGQALALNWGSNTNAAICAIAFEFAE